MSRRRPTPPADPAHPDWSRLESWAFLQQQPFRFSDVLPHADRVFPKALDPETSVRGAARFLQSHPSIVLHDQRFFTPYMLARHVKFRIRPSPEERARGVLWLFEDRFLPFMRPRATSLPILVILPNKTYPKHKRARLPAARIAELAPISAYAHGASGAARSDPQVWTAALPMPHTHHGDWLARAPWFASPIFALEPSSREADQDAEALHPKLRETLRALLAAEETLTPPAARTLLQLLAIRWEDVAGRVVGPLLPMLTDDTGIRLETREGAVRFAFTKPSQPPSAARHGTAQDHSGIDSHPDTALARARLALKEYLDLLPPDVVDRAQGYESAVQFQTADPVGGRIKALVQGSARLPYQVVLGIDPAATYAEDFVHLESCTCPYAADYGICKHLAAVAQSALHRFGGARERHRDAPARAPRPARPPPPEWETFLGHIDRLLQLPDNARSRESRPERLVWVLSSRGVRMRLSPKIQKRLDSGRWTQGAQVGPQWFLTDSSPLVTPQDRMAAAALAGNSLAWGSRQFPADTWFTALLRMEGHPGVVTAHDHPLAVERAELRLQVERAADGAVRFRAAVGDLVPGEGATVWTSLDGVMLADFGAGRVTLAPASLATMTLVRTLTDRVDPLPAEAAEAVLARIPLLEGAVPVFLPPEWQGAEVAADPRLRLRLAPGEKNGLQVEIRVRPLPPPAPDAEPGAGAAVPRGWVDGKRVFAQRDLAAEKGCAEALVAALGLDAGTAQGPWRWRIPDNDSALDFVARVQAMQDARSAQAALTDQAALTAQAAPAAPAMSGAEAPPGVDFVVEWPRDAAFRVLGAANADLRVQVTSARDWFGLAGDVVLDGETVALVEVLRALREGRRYVPVRPGTWLAIDALLRQRLGPLALAVREGDAGLEVGPTAAPLIADLAREKGTIRACRAWQDMFRRFERASELSPDAPSGLTADLRPYQLEGYRWLRRLAEWGVGACLADDMGLGKTVQMLALLLDRASAGPALVVAPVSVGANWVREARRFAPELNPVLYRETDREGRGRFRPGDLVIVSYGLILRDVERLARTRWHTLVLDEAQFVKNSRTRTAQSLRSIEADARFALTGTPLENHLGDLWGLFRNVSPGLFGSWESFRERWAVPIERGGDHDRRSALARVVRPFILRRTKDEVLKELPPRTDMRLTAQLSAGERKLYDAARIEALARLESAKGTDPQRRIQVLAALTRLRQLSCHPRLVYPEMESSSAKLDLLLETVGELREEGHRALVFSQFTSHLALVREALDGLGVRYQYLDGKTPARERQRRVDAFQAGEGELFLISLKAGGTGLNLTAADYVIHLDPWWNPAVEDQATDRAHRIGQDKPVMVYRLIASDTIEERILAMHEDKRDLVAGVLEGADRAGRLSTDELIDLIREGAAVPAGVGE